MPKVLFQNGVWYSVELHWKLGLSTAGVVELYVDGVKIIEVTGINTAYFGNARRVDLGLVQATGVQKSLTINADCAMVSQSYIGPESSSLLSVTPELAFDGKLVERFDAFAFFSSSKLLAGTALLLLLLTLYGKTAIFNRKSFMHAKRKLRKQKFRQRFHEREFFQSRTMHG